MTSGGDAQRDAPRLALLGAFPFPVPQGSQVYMADQARALARTGAAPTLFTYGRGRGPLPDDLDFAPAPRWASPRAMRSGPHVGKPLADAALLAAYVRGATRRRFAFALAHNAEAACVALAARPVTGVPVVYVAHTLLGHELSAYAGPRWQRALDRVGARIDAAIARRVDGIVALCDAAAAELAPLARGPVAVLAPGHVRTPAPSRDLVERTCARHGLVPDAFFLYTGNLDGYQDLELLAAAAQRMPADSPPVVIATHDAGRTAPSLRADPARLRVVTVADFAETRALTRGARTVVLTRRRPGGFPVKLLNYMEAARPIVAFAGVAVGLVDGESARLLDPGLAFEPSADALARALVELHRDDGSRERLGVEAARHLARHHDWNDIAARTRALLGEVDAARASDHFGSNVSTRPDG